MADERDREIAELKARLAALEGTFRAPGAAAPIKPRKKGGGAQLALALLGLVLLLAVISSLSHQGASSGVTGANTTIPAASTAENVASNAGPAPTTPWSYHDDTDAMGRTKHYACTTSTNQITQGAPYHDVDAKLCLRRGGKGALDAYVELDGDGQVLCGIEDCEVPIRFDNGAIQRFPAVGAADNSSNIIFIRSESKFASALKRSAKAAIELRIYQNGDQGVVFDTAGLKWP